MNAVANVWKSPRMSEGAASASACNSFAYVSIAVAGFPDVVVIALAIFAAMSANSLQFFALANPEAEPELAVVVADVVAADMVVDIVVEAELFVPPPPPHPAPTASSPTAAIATATRTDVNLIWIACLSGP